MRLLLSGPQRLLADEGGYVDAGPMVLVLEGQRPGLTVEIRPGRNLVLALIPLAEGQRRNCASFGTWTNGGYYLWQSTYRLPVRIWLSDFGSWAWFDRLCGGLGRYRVYAVLATMHADRLFVLPGDPFFEVAAERPGAVARVGVRGAPLLVELPPKGVAPDGLPLEVWGADLPPGQVAYAVSNGLDVELVDVATGLRGTDDALPSSGGTTR